MWDYKNVTASVFDTPFHPSTGRDAFYIENKTIKLNFLATVLKISFLIPPPPPPPPG